jgi:hypothetical protein
LVPRAEPTATNPDSSYRTTESARKPQSWSPTEAAKAATDASKGSTNASKGSTNASKGSTDAAKSSAHAASEESLLSTACARVLAGWCVSAEATTGNSEVEATSAKNVMRTR